MLTLWHLVYVITVLSGPAKDSAGAPISYPYSTVEFEPPSDWFGCYNQKRIGLPLRQKQKGPTIKVTASCLTIGLAK